ncbi:E3 ubiquitin-protein ligase TRIM71-like [Dysidea avara]|uniref:E3 ubiquitin-protein ligase TRIM71-like n=1 Tax=Dysidea avara TaxID=196820 RepID=UPI00331D02D9
MLERVRRALKELEDIENQIDVEGVANIEMIRATYEEVHKLLKQQQQEAIDKANANKRSCKKRLATQKENSKFLETRNLLNPFKETAQTDQIKVTVTLNDAFGFPVVKQSTHIEIRCNKDEGFLQNTCIKERLNGQYFIWYTPKISENHLLQIYWKGHLVNHEEIKVLMTVRDYNNVGQAAKTIKKYGSSNTLLLEPNLLAKGSNNELIVCDHSTKQLVVFDKQFQYSHVIGGAGRGNGKFQRVTHWTGVLSQSEQLFVCDSSNDRIQVFQYEKFTYGFGQHGTEPGDFNHPQDLALDNSEDQLFITDHCNDRVQVFTPKGQFLRFFDRFTNVMFRLNSPFGIHYTPNGYLLASSQDSNCILVFKEDGNFVHAIENMYRGKKRFSDPRGVLVFDNGNPKAAAHVAVRPSVLVTEC